MSEYQDEAPTGDVRDNDYTSRSGQYQIPVQKDEAPVEDPIDAKTADTDEQLGRYFMRCLCTSNLKMNSPKLTPIRKR
jgi:hypothetical protein